MSATCCLAVTRDICNNDQKWSGHAGCMMPGHMWSGHVGCMMHDYKLSGLPSCMMHDAWPHMYSLVMQFAWTMYNVVILAMPGSTALFSHSQGNKTSSHNSLKARSWIIVLRMYLCTCIHKLFRLCYICWCLPCSASLLLVEKQPGLMFSKHTVIRIARLLLCTECKRRLGCIVRFHYIHTNSQIGAMYCIISKKNYWLHAPCNPS